MSSQADESGQPRGAGRPPGATGDRTRSEILDAALEAFAEAGFEATSVRGLTRRLGVSHNLVHHHFGSKDDLWRAALDHGVGRSAGELFDLLGESIGSADPKQVLRQGLEQAIELLTRRPEVVRILADESARESSRLDYLYDRYLGPMIAVLSRFLAESRVHGVRDVDSRVAALFVLSSAFAQVTHEGLANKLGLGTVAQGGYVESIVDLVLEGLMTPAADGSGGT